MVVTSEVFLQNFFKWGQRKLNPTNKLSLNDFLVNKQILAHCNYLLMVQFSAWWRDFHVFTTKSVICETLRCLRYCKNCQCYNTETNCRRELHWKPHKPLLLTLTLQYKCMLVHHGQAADGRCQTFLHVVNRCLDLCEGQIEWVVCVCACMCVCVERYQQTVTVPWLDKFVLVHTHTRRPVF